MVVLAVFLEFHSILVWIYLGAADFLSGGGAHYFLSPKDVIKEFIDQAINHHRIDTFMGQGGVIIWSHLLGKVETGEV